MKIQKREKNVAGFKKKLSSYKKRMKLHKTIKAAKDIYYNRDWRNMLKLLKKGVILLMICEVNLLHLA